MKLLGRLRLAVLLVSMMLFGSLAGTVFAVPPALADANTVLAQISVNGSGVVKVIPDQAKVSLGVLTMGSSSTQAQAQNASIANGVVSALIGMGIAKDRIATQDFSVIPQYSYPKPGDTGTPVIMGYQVNNTVVVTLDNIKQVGAVIDAAIKAGANQVTSIQFVKKETSTAQGQALQLACREARLKAEAIAQALGVQITGIQSVQENSNITPGPVFNAFNKSAAGADVATPIEPTSLQVSANVAIVFLIKQ